MKKLFDGLNDLGFENVDDLDAFKPVEKKPDAAPVKPGEKVITPEECLFEKKYTCPVCNNVFQEATVKTSKPKFLHSSPDLMPVYTPIYPFFYNVVLCPGCGYTALSTNFLLITDSQCALIKKNITPKFKAKKYKIPFTEQDAIERNKLALLNSVVKNGRASEKAYISLVISWLYNLLEDKDNRLLFAKNAYELFVEAYSKDTFPVYGMDENVTAYLVAELARLNGLYDESLKWVSRVITSRLATAKVKDLARDLRDKVKNEME